MLFVNFKTYEEATGEKAVELAKICEKVSQETGKEIVLCVQALDVYRVSQAVSLKVYGQHADEAGYGSHTGSVTLEALKQAGAVGSILNHSENRIGMEKIKAVVAKCSELDFPILVCAQDANEVKEISSLGPNFVAYEPPELIGGDISVSSAKPEVIAESVTNADEIPLIVGAGVKVQKDVSKSVQMGAKGVLVASGVVKASDRESAIKDLLDGF